MRRPASAPGRALVLLAAPMALAGTPGATSTHEQRVTSAWNRHRAGGADSRRLDVRVVVVRTGADVRAYEWGTDRDLSMTSEPAGSRTREATRTWHRAWSGTWRVGGDQATVQLTRAAETCRIDVRQDRSAPEREPCRSSDETLRLVCDAWRGDAALAGATGWRCAATEPTTAATLPWFVADRCVAVGRGPGGRMSLDACPPDPGPPAR